MCSRLSGPGFSSPAAAALLAAAVAAVAVIAGCKGSSGSEPSCRAAETKLRSCDLDAFVDSPSYFCSNRFFDGVVGACIFDCVAAASCAELTAGACEEPGKFDDCVDGCESLTFACADGTEIPVGWECDGDLDCPDGSDEHDGCQVFLCADGTEIPVLFECDGISDCPDGSDEHNECPGFRCDDGTVIPDLFECDSIPDCPDGSDEHDGCTVFRCEEGTLIPSFWECDGETHCPDGSDEHDGCWYLEVCRL